MSVWILQVGNQSTPPELKTQWGFAILYESDNSRTTLFNDGFLASFKSTLHFFSTLPICRGFFPKDCNVLLGSYEGYLILHKKTIY